MDDPFHLDDVEITREHHRLTEEIRGSKARARSGRDFFASESKFLLQDALSGDDLHSIDAKRQLEVQSGVGDPVHTTEALDDGSLLGLHGIKGAERSPPQQSNTQNDDDRPGAGTTVGTSSSAA